VIGPVRQNAAGGLSTAAGDPTSAAMPPSQMKARGAATLGAAVVGTGIGSGIIAS